MARWQIDNDDDPSNRQDEKLELISASPRRRFPLKTVVLVALLLVLVGGGALWWFRDTSNHADFEHEWRLDPEDPGRATLELTITHAGQRTIAVEAGPGDPFDPAQAARAVAEKLRTTNPDAVELFLPEYNARTSQLPYHRTYRLQVAAETGGDFDLLRPDQAPSAQPYWVVDVMRNDVARVTYSLEYPPIVDPITGGTAEPELHPEQLRVRLANRRGEDRAEEEVFEIPAEVTSIWKQRDAAVRAYREALEAGRAALAAGEHEQALEHFQTAAAEAEHFEGDAQNAALALAAEEAIENARVVAERQSAGRVFAERVEAAGEALAQAEESLASIPNALAAGDVEGADEELSRAESRLTVELPMPPITDVPSELESYRQRTNELASRITELEKVVEQRRAELREAQFADRLAEAQQAIAASDYRAARQAARAALEMQSGDEIAARLLADAETALENGKRLGYQRPGVAVRQLQFDAEGVRLASLHADGALEIRNVADRARQFGPFIGGESVSAAALGHGFNRLAAYDTDAGLLRVWDLSEEKPSARSFESDPAEVTALAFTPDDRILLAGSELGNVRRWDVETARKTAGFYRFRRPGVDDESAVSALDVAADGRWLAIGSSTGAFVVWDLQTLKELKRIDAYGALLTAMALSPDNRQLVILNNEQQASWWLVDPEEITRRIAEAEGVTAFAYGRTAATFARGYADGRVQVWFEGGALADADFAAHQAAVTALAVLESGWIATGAADGSVALWRPQAGEKLPGREEGQAAAEP